MKFIKLTLISLFISIFSFGQGYDLNDTIPLDPTVRVGKLENGITYFVKHNSTPKGKAELRLAIDAGSILEDEDQQGLAHFIEHMAFNGTRNFEKNELINYLQNLGVRFGADLNAHTSFNETVYKLSLPADNQEIFTTGLQILRDWADGISFDSLEIEKERGVILSEALNRKGVKSRIFDVFAFGVTNGSRYYYRMPIGKEEIIASASRDKFTRFYSDWYRTDLMSVIVVGDIDIDLTEKQIKEYFGSMEAVAEPRERIYYKIPANDGIKVSAIKDKEATEYNFQLFFKQEKDTTNKLSVLRDRLLQRLYTSMMNERFNELFLKGDAEYMSASASIGNLLATTESYYLSGSLKENAIFEGLEMILREHERARRFGFTQDEFERHKSKVLSSAYNAMLGKESAQSRTLVDMFVDHYIDNVPVPGPDFYYDFYNSILQDVKLEEVNAVAEKWIVKDNVSLVFSSADKEGVKLPTEDELERVWLNSYSLELEQYDAEVVDRPLMTQMPVAGQVVKSEFVEDVGIHLLTLSNGVEVVLKPSGLRKDIVMSGFRPGGSSLAHDSLYFSVRHASDLVFNSGLNGLTSSQLRKVNNGKAVSVKPIINFYDEQVNGKSSLQDVETMLQMTHLYFTAPYKNNDVFDAYKEWLMNKSMDADVEPVSFFYDEVSRVMSQHHLRAVPIKPNEYRDGFFLDKAFDFYVSRFSNAHGFKFVFVGDFDVDEITPLIETYLASLPSVDTGKPESADIGLRYRSGIVKRDYHLNSEDKSMVVLHWNGVLKHNLRKKMTIDALAAVLKLRLYEEVREKMGGVYGVGVSGFTTNVPYEWFRFGVEFSCNPADVDKILDVIHAEIEKLKEEGVSESDVLKVTEAMKVSARSGLNNNDYWMYRIKDVMKYGLGWDYILKIESEIERIDAKSLQKAARKYFSGKNYAQFVLYPKN